MIIVSDHCLINNHEPPIRFKDLVSERSLQSVETLVRPYCLLKFISYLVKALLFVAGFNIGYIVKTLLFVEGL